MIKVIIDTNVLVSFLTDRNPRQQEQAATLFERAASLRTAIICHPNVIAEFIYVMDSVYRVQKNELHSMVRDLIELPALTVIQDFDLKTTLLYWPASVSDYGDSLLAALCKRTRNSAVGTFDRKFQRELIDLGLPVYEDWQ